MTLDLTHARPHDLGGRAAGPIDRHEHDPQPWERLVTAIVGALRERRLVTVDEMRRAMEDMPPEDYRRLLYFERWAVGLKTLAVEKGLITEADLERRVKALAR